MKIQISENIDLSQSERFILTIRVHPEQFSFSLHNPADTASCFHYSIEKDKQLSALSSFKEAYFDNEFFALTYKKIYIINHTPVFTYIPSIIFEDKDKDAYLNFLFMEKSGKSLFHQLKTQEITILHVMPDDVYDFFQRTFLEGEIIHHTAPLIAYFHSERHTINQKKMVVNWQNNGMDIFCFSRETFLLGNHFTCGNLSDAVYYILFIWKQLKFNQMDDFLYIIGDTKLKKDLIENLNPYIQQIVPFDIVPEMTSEIACLSLCEL
jgi:hypothetical protein